MCKFLSVKLFKNITKVYSIEKIRTRSVCTKPKHLICFRNWTSDMLLNILDSAMNLKHSVGDTHRKRLKVLKDSKIMILQEVNEPFLNMAVSKAATLLGAYDVNITDKLLWDNHYMGRIFSYMADAIFVSTMKHMCLQRFADQSTVPVLCMRSRTHATIQAMSTIMAILEEFKTFKNVNLAYFGPPHPVLNSYLLLCPMLGANIRFKCCCEKCPVSPLLFKVSEDMCNHAHTGLKQCMSKADVLKDAMVVIAGPTDQDKVDEFRLSVEDIESLTKNKWIFFHTGPRGKEVDNNLFLHSNSKTYVAFENFQYIAAALMADVINNHKF